MLAAMAHVSTLEPVHLSLAAGNLLSFPALLINFQHVFVILDQAQSLLNKSRPMVLDDNSTPVLLQVLLNSDRARGLNWLK